MNVTHAHHSSYPSTVTPLHSAASSVSSFSLLSAIVTLLALYLAACQYLRFQRRDAMTRKLGYSTRESMRRMTDDDAQLIVAYLGELEFPRIVLTSLQFALFKTYGIPTISRLLVATKELAIAQNAVKRYADTTVLLAEFMGQKPQSDRGTKAIARMNFIHSLYQKKGAISNDDMLYTLSVFISEPIAWVEKYEWRAMNQMEICGTSTFWKSIGDSMQISYSALPSYPDKWQDGIQFYDEILAWATEYETQHMVPKKTNSQLAAETSVVLLFHVPAWARPVAMKFISAMCPERLRIAMSFAQPTQIYFQLLGMIFETRRFVLRHLSLPRPEFLAVRQCSKHADPLTGNYHLNDYQALPYYVKPSFLKRWGPEAWLVRLNGKPVPGDDGTKFYPQGYKIEDVGPVSMVGHGLAETSAIQTSLLQERLGGCPFAFPS